MVDRVRIDSPGSRRQRGFSLLEVLVAFSIMAMSLAVLYQSVGGSVRGFSEAERNVKAVLLAEALLASHDVVPPDGLHFSGTQGGEFGWQLTSSRQELTIENPVSELHRVEVQVTWEDRGRSRMIRLSSLRPVASALR